MTILNTGNVGIGTTSPGQKLEIAGTGDMFKMSRSGVGAFTLGITTQNSQDALSFKGDSGTVRMAIDDSGVLYIPGYVGIGTISPTTSLTVQGTQTSGSNKLVAEFTKTGGSTYGSTYIRVSRDPGSTQAVEIEQNSGGSGPFRYGTYSDAVIATTANASNGPYGSIHFVTNSATRLYIGGGTQAGNVGIGTTNPTTKLTVDGTITAEEVVVEAVGADYVFDKDYRLMPLGELKRAILRQHHLPGIPSASEIETKGMRVGDMQTKLLQKVEELTLYTLAQQDEIQGLRDLVRQLEGRLARLEQTKN